MPLEDYHNLAYWADDLARGHEDPPNLLDEERRRQMATDKDIDARLGLLRDEVQEDARIPAVVTTPDESLLSLQRRIRGLLVGDDFEWAETTLRGILGTITETGRVTMRQVEAVDRIADTPNRGSSRSRRQGGW